MWHAWFYYGSHKVEKRSLTLYSVTLANWLARGKLIGGNHDIPHDGYIRTHQENALIYRLRYTEHRESHGNNHDLYILRNRQSSISWWRHQMETFSTLLAICAGNSPVSGEFPAQKPVTRSFGVFFDLRLNKRLSKQSWGWWFETLSCPL